MDTNKNVSVYQLKILGFEPDPASKLDSPHEYIHQGKEGKEYMFI